MLAQSFGPMILINRAANWLTLFRANNRVWRVFPVATAGDLPDLQAGRFSIVVKWVNLWWYPPDLRLVGRRPAGAAGPGNPLDALDGPFHPGCRHPRQADAPSSIGSSASHGCIRMQVADSEWLFSRVKVGTTVFIV